MRYEYTLAGQTPLLMNNDNIEFADRLKEWQKDPDNKKVSVAGDDRSPGWSWFGKLYLSQNLGVVLPTDNLSACLRAAGARMILSKQKTFKESAVAGLWFDEEELAVKVDGKPVSAAGCAELAESGEYEFDRHQAAAHKAGFSLFMKRARVGQSKHVRVRPLFKGWSVSGTLTVTEKELTGDVVARLFDIAGTRIGLGDWRPGCKTPGRFGMFAATIKAAK